MHKRLGLLIILLSAACGNENSSGGSSTKSGAVRDMVAERAAMAKFKDRACACNDGACANKVADDMKAWMMTDRGTPPPATKEDADKDYAVMLEFTKCLDKARGGQH
jgi:hypothetical protein